METGMFKRLASIAILAVGFCLMGCNKPTPEQVAERTELLFQAIENDDMEQAKACIKSGANVNAMRWGKGPTPLLYAIRENRTEILKLLLESKADLNNEEYRTMPFPPLTLAISSKNYDIVAILIKYGADINKVDGYDRSPLALAAILGSTDIVNLLLKSGADVNAKDTEGSTVLMIACSRGYREIASLLIKFGADVNAKDEGCLTALMIASTWGHGEIVNLLLESCADVNAKDTNGLTALTYAKMAQPVTENQSVIKQLKAAGATE